MMMIDDDFLLLFDNNKHLSINGYFLCLVTVFTRRSVHVRTCRVMYQHKKCSHFNKENELDLLSEFIFIFTASYSTYSTVCPSLET